MISNPHPSLQAEKRDKRKQIPKSQGDYLNSARISFGLFFFFSLSFLFCNMSALRWIMTQALNVDTPKLNNNLPYGALIHQETSWTVTRETRDTNTCNTVIPLHLSHSTIAHLPFYFFAASFTQTVCDEQRKQLSPVTAPATVKTQ